MNEYKCVICNKTLKEKPIRLIKYIYGAGRFNQFSQVDKWDFCKRCYAKFENWINKHRRDNEKNNI